MLRDALRRYPDSVEAWDGWLTGLDDGHEPDLLRQEFSRLPKALAADQRFAKHEGSVAQGVGDWPKAVAAYHRAYEFEPFNGVVLYRLRMAVRAVGQTAESIAIDKILTDYQTAFKQMRASLSRDSGGQNPWPAATPRTLPPAGRLCVRRWADLTRPVPGTVWCCATPPTICSALPPWSGSSNMRKEFVQRGTRPVPTFRD